MLPSGAARALVPVLALAVGPCAARAHAQVTLTSAPVHEQHARPGERYELRIELANGSDAPQRVRVYLTDQDARADGRVLSPAPGTTPRSNARWITTGPRELVIAPRARAAVPIAVQVPADTVLDGSWRSMVMIEGAGEPGGAARTAGVRMVMRLGVQVATHIGGTGIAKVAFDSVLATSEGSSRMLRYDFSNVGTRATRLLMSVELFDAQGRVVRRLEQQRGLLHPGNSARQRFDLGQLPAGRYVAVVTADGGGDQLFGAQYTLRF